MDGIRSQEVHFWRERRAMEQEPDRRFLGGFLEDVVPVFFV